MSNSLNSPEFPSRVDGHDFSGIPDESKINYYRSDKRPMSPRAKKVAGAILGILALTPVVWASREIDERRFEKLEQVTPTPQSPSPDNLIPEFPPLEPLEPLFPPDEPGLKPYPYPSTNDDPKSTWQSA